MILLDSSSGVTITTLIIAAIPGFLVSLGAFINSIRIHKDSKEAKGVREDLKVAVNGRMTDLIDVLKSNVALETRNATLEGLTRGYRIAEAEHEAGDIAKLETFQKGQDSATTTTKEPKPHA